MSKAKNTNIPVSIKTRLLNLSRESRLDYMKLLVRYLQERLLYRISMSAYREHLLLKGSALLYAYQPFDARPTVDIDLLGHQWSNSPDEIKAAFAQICAIECEEDGVTFDAETLRIAPIAIEKRYPGVCVVVDAHLDTIVQPVSIDIGFGDVVTPGPHQMDYPVLLDEMPRPTLMAYSLESSIAEKFHAMIERDSQNSRMKDFFDVYMILMHYEVELEVLAEAIRNTFRRRETRYTPYAALFAEGFATEAGRVQQWRAFLKRIRWPEEIDFAEVVACICDHIGPCWNERNIDE